MKQQVPTKTKYSPFESCLWVMQEISNRKDNEQPQVSMAAINSLISSVKVEAVLITFKSKKEGEFVKVWREMKGLVLYPVREY